MFQPIKSNNCVRRRKKVKENQMPDYSTCSNEEKILNASSKDDMIMNVCDAFEEILKTLNIVSRNEKIYEKLCVIENLIQLKTSHLRSSDNLVGSPGFNKLSLASSLSSSVHSLCSEASDSYLDNDINFKMFLKQVNCPFCEQSHADKIKLISHLDTTCRPIISRVFAEKGKHIPYSVFQILPNNCIKCNVCSASVYSKVKQYFLHEKSRKHKENYLKMRVTKQFTNYLFCSCCKVLVPDNNTEFEIHINLEVHKKRSSLSFNQQSYLKKGIHCVYMKCKNFNCIQCNLKFVTSVEILKHIEGKDHVEATKRKKLGDFVIFCDFCLSSVRAFEVLKHFSSTEHKMEEQKDREAYFRVCLYCGFTCDELSELASHMESNCNNINKLRKSIMKTNFDETNFQTVRLKKEKDTEENSNPEQKNYVIIKGYTKLPELYRYFKQIGEIDSIEIYKKKDAIIHFKEKTSVNDVLLLREVNKINGVKLKITTEKENEDEEVEKKGKENKKNNKKSDSNEESASCSGSSDSDPFNSSSDEISLDEQTEQLFQRVSTHLRKNLHKVDPILEEKLIQDSRDIFNCRSFTLIGFTGCELSFPLERISFYCEAPTLSYDGQTLNSDTFTYNKGITKVYFKKMVNSPLWEDVFCTIQTPFPYISCKHKDTKKSCTFTFMQSAKIVSDLLRYYLEKSDEIKSFVLITKFWINVHELEIGEHEFAIISLLISFLIGEEIVEPNTELNSLPIVFHFCEAIKALNIGVQSQVKSKSTDISAVGLFHRFLRFIYKFDFTKNVIYLPFKSPVPRVLLNKVPVSSLLENIKSGDSTSTSSPMCVIDPLLYVNLTSGVTEVDIEAFLEAIESTLFKDEVKCQD